MEKTQIYVTIRLKDREKTVLGNKIAVLVNDIDDPKEVAESVTIELCEQQDVNQSWVEYGFSEELDFDINNLIYYTIGIKN